MKAKFFVLGLCALALAACSLDEVSQINDSNAISFKASVPHSTRAAATSAANLDAFTVWAWTDGNVLMDHVTATNNGSGTYTTNPMYFWPSTAVDFLAVSPVVDATDGTNFYIGGSVTDDIETGDTYYTGHVGKVTIDEGGNKVLFDVPSSYGDQIDFCYAVTPNQSSGSVPMNFRHALSQVVFKAANTNETLTIKVAGVSVCSIYKTGQYTLPTVSTSYNLATDTEGTDGISDSQGEWKVGTAYGKSHFDAGLAAETIEVGTETTALSASDGSLFLIPQEVVAWDVLEDQHLTGFGAYFRVLCRIEEGETVLWPNSLEEDAYAKDSSTANLQEIDGEHYAEIAIPVDVDWKEGYKYTYTFIFGEGAGYYPPDDPNYEEDGTPVLVPINFTVTVDEFQSAEEVEVSTGTSAITVHSATELEAAIAAGYSDITVTESITLDGEYLDFTSDCTLTLGEGVVITATNATDTSYPSINGYNGYTAAICVTSGTLTINGEGSVVTTGGSEAKGTEGIWVNGGNVIINGGTYKGGSWNTDVEGSESAVFVEYGAAYIYGGTFSSGRWKESGNLYYVLNCMDTPRRNGEAWIYVYGGSYYLFDPSNCNSEGAGTNFVVDGYEVTENSPESGWYTVNATN